MLRFVRQKTVAGPWGRRAHLAAGLALAALALPHSGLAVDGTPREPLIRPLNRAWFSSAPTASAPGEHRWGADFRARYVDIRNAIPLLPEIEETIPALHLDQTWQEARLRTRISLDYRRSSVIRLFGMLTNEATRYSACDSCEGGVGEVIFENLYVEAVEPWDLPVAIRLGRQDLFYGDGFLVADGGPLDQSRTSYVNGVLLTSRIPLWSVDAFWVRQPRRDDYLPRINNQYTLLVEGDEIAWGIVASREPAPGTSLRYGFEPYYIYKKESQADQAATIHTVGARVEFKVGKGRATAEAAYQGGKIPEAADYNDPLELLTGPQPISAIGGHARLQIHLSPPIPLDLTAGYVLLSGDEVKTRNKYEGWNPILGRWPAWSDILAYALIGDAYAPPTYPTLGYWQNLSMPFVVAGYGRGPVAIEVKCLWLDALTDLPTREKIFQPGLEHPKHRGELYGAKLSWTLPWLVAGHVLYELFDPGDFYPRVERDGQMVRPGNATYLRVQLTRSL
jgi:hypothetical protein